MEFIIDLAVTFWQWTVVIAVIAVSYLINKLDKPNLKRIDFHYTNMPTMQPLQIKTASKGFWGAIWMWLTGTRQWVITEDFHYWINSQKYKIPAGFQFDGASVPKFLATFLSPVGVLLMGGLVHDYGYKYATLMKKDGSNIGYRDQKYMDGLFRDICIEVNGFYALNYLAYYALRLAGFVAWNGHKKRGTQLEVSK
jgi:hypothetical protein